MGAKKSETVVAAAELRRSGRKRKVVDYGETDDLKVVPEDPPVKKRATRTKTPAKKAPVLDVTEDHHEDADYEEEEDKAEMIPQKAAKKKATPPKPKKAPAKKEKVTEMDLAEDDDEEAEAEEEAEMGSKKAGKQKAEVPAGEKRLRKWRPKAPQSYWTIHDRAMSQRMFVIDRTRGGSEDKPEETMTIAGTTGNLYTIKIGELLSCDCPHARMGNHCKHIVYAMCRVLHAPEHLQYQLALVPSELREIFANAPPIPTADAEAPESDGNRKPVTSDEDCPICCMPFEPEKEEIVYCKAACGNNIHRDCFNTWAQTKKREHRPVTCPFCRTLWQEATLNDGEMVKLAKDAKESGVTQGHSSYVNVGSQLGLSGRRDYSTYHPFWVHRQYRDGVDTGGEFFRDEFVRYR